MQIETARLHLPHYSQCLAYIHVVVVSATEIQAQNASNISTPTVDTSSRGRTSAATGRTKSLLECVRVERDASLARWREKIQEPRNQPTGASPLLALRELEDILIIVF